MTASVLRRCEVRGQEVEGGPVVPCQRPGTFYTASSSGHAYCVCEYHAGRFEQLTAIAETCDITTPETGSNVHQYDGHESWAEQRDRRMAEPEARAGYDEARTEHSDGSGGSEG